MKTSRTRKSTVAQRDGPDGQNWKQSLCSCLAAVLRPTVLNKQTQNNGERNHFWQKFIRKPVSLYLNAIRVILPKT